MGRITEKMEGNKPRTDLPYYIYNSEEGSEGWRKINFSLHTDEIFPDFYCDRQQVGSKSETWRVRNGEEVEIQIDSSYQTKKELAKRLDREYQKALD